MGRDRGDFNVAFAGQPFDVQICQAKSHTQFHGKGSLCDRAIPLQLCQEKKISLAL
jgi:hypothetical protein